MSARPPYYRTPGGGRPSLQGDAALHQLSKSIQAATSPTATRAPQLPIPVPAPPPASGGSVTVQDPLQLDGTQISLPPASGTQAGWIETVGDLGGTGDAPVVVGLQGRPVDSAAPTATYYLGWDGSKWTPTPLPSSGSDAAWAARSANFTIDATLPYVEVDTSAVAVTVTLPQASAYLAGAHPPLTIKIHPSGHNLTFAAHAGDDIDGGASITITNAFDTLTVVVRADGSGWGTMHPQP